MRYLTAALLAALTLTTGTQAATLVVDQKARTASDINPGTRAAPLKTISAAALRVKPGDTVLVRPGVYREAVHLTVSGSLGKPITFRSETPQAAIIDGADAVTAFTPETAGVWSFPAPNIAPLGRDDNAGEWIPGEVIYLNGAPLTRVTDKTALIPGTYLLDYPAKRVLLAPYEGQTPNQVKIEFTTRNGLIAAEKPLDDIHVQGFTLIHNGDWFGSLHALTIVGQRWVVENNKILWSSYAGIAFRHSNHCIVRSNLIDWAGAEDVVGNSTANLLFANNRLLHGNWQRQETDFEGGGLKMVSTYDSLFKSNEVADFYGYGMWFDIACGDNTFQGNLIHDSVHGGALFTEISWRVHYLDNMVFNNQYGLEIGESSECELHRNISFDNNWGVYPRDDGRRKASAQYGYQSVADFEKNLAADIPGLDLARIEKMGKDYRKYWATPDNFQLAYTTLTDNLIFDNTVAYTEWRNYGQPSFRDAYIHDNVSDHNIFWASAPNTVFGYETGGGAWTGYADLAQWQRLSGRDLHSVYADPRDPATPVPAWAQAKRKVWGRKMRTRAEIEALNLGLMESPSGAEAQGRLARAASVTPFETGDPAIKAFVFDFDGQKTLALWTTQVSVRRPLRLALNQPNVTVEDGYGQTTKQRLRGGAITLHVGYLPLYLRGVGPSVQPVPATGG